MVITGGAPSINKAGEIENAKSKKEHDVKRNFKLKEEDEEDLEFIFNPLKSCHYSINSKMLMP